MAVFLLLAPVSGTLTLARECLHNWLPNDIPEHALIDSPLPDFTYRPPAAAALVSRRSRKVLVMLSPEGQHPLVYDRSPAISRPACRFHGRRAVVVGYPGQPEVPKTSRPSRICPSRFPLRYGRDG